MRITVDIREDAFRTPKTPQQVAEEIRQAAAIFWVARGDVAPEDAKRVATSPSPTEGADQGPMAFELLLRGPDVGEDADFERTSGTQPEPPKDFKAFLLSMPDVGDDSIFERPLDYGREVDLCDT